MSWSSRGRSCGFRFLSPLIQSSKAQSGGEAQPYPSSQYPYPLYIRSLLTGCPRHFWRGGPRESDRVPPSLLTVGPGHF